MLLTPHTITGIAVASAVPNPAISIPLSFALHFLGDMVPHWDFFADVKEEELTKGWRLLAVMADIAIGVFIGTAFTLYALWILKNPPQAVNIFLCGIAAVLPDAISAPALFKTGSSFISKVTLEIQKKVEFNAPLPWGVISQAFVVAASFLLISNSLGQ